MLFLDICFRPLEEKEVNLRFSLLNTWKPFPTEQEDKQRLVCALSQLIGDKNDSYSRDIGFI